ncbi:MAG: hypothetical protein AAGB32_01180 [Pseudomonadota bacterium]
MYDEQIQNGLFSIASSERFYRVTEGDEIVEWWHSFFSLVDKTTPVFSAASISAQLHIVNSSQGYFDVIATSAMREASFEKTVFFPTMGARGKVLMPQWRRLYDFFNELKDRPVSFGLNPRFSETATNCRTAVRDGFRLIGADLPSKHTKSIAGMRAPSLIQ